MRLADLRPALALCLILTVAVPAAAVVSFRTTEEEDALLDGGSDNAQAVTIADVDGDTLGDVIAVEPGADVVTVFVNAGEGELNIGEPFDTEGAGPVAVATGLFNGDTFVDIVTANSGENTISVLLNDVDGEGFFDDEAPRRFQVAANPQSIAVGDFNGDTRADLAVLSPDALYLLQGNGDGTFSAFNPASIFPRTSNSTLVKAGLLDANNTLDLVILNRDSAQGGQAAVFLGGGDGTFTFNGFVNVGSALTGLVISDADGDLMNDLIFVDSEAILLDEVRLLRNAGDATFEAPESVTGPEAPLAITALDVEPDGKVDLAVTTVNDDQIFLLCQLSDKCTQVTGGGLEAGIWRSGVGGTIPGCTDGGQVAIASGKLDDDNMDDLVALKGDLSTLCLMLNASSAGAEPTATPIGTVATSTPTGPTPTPTETRTPTNTATPTEVPTIGLRECEVPNVDGTEFDQPVSVTTEDFDRDGTRDVAVADRAAGRVITILTTLGVPDDDLCNAFSRRLGASLEVTAPRALVAADLEPNGTADLVVIGTQGLSVFFGNGSGGFVASSANPIPAGNEPSDIAVSDFNRDSIADLIISDEGSEDVSIFLGTRQQAQPFSGRCVMPVGRQTNKVIAADLNVDGRSDFAVTGPQTRDVGVFLQMPDATLACGTIDESFQGQTVLNLPQSRQPVGLVSGLFAQTDSIPDLVVAMRQDNASGSVLLFEGRAAGTGVTYVGGTPVLVPTPKGGTQIAVPSAIGTGDIERDGRPDLILTDTGNDSLAEFRGQNGGVGVPLEPLLLGAGLDPVDLEVADIDGDTRDDVIVADATGSVIYLLSGLRLATPTPTVTNTPAATTPPTVAGTATLSPTITQTPTRSRRPSSTPTPLPTNTQRGVVTLIGNGCNVDNTSGDSCSLPIAAFALTLFTLRRRALARLRG
jgi:hypothetical protein